jgi:hypothetical protein
MRARTKYPREGGQVKLNQSESESGYAAVAGMVVLHTDYKAREPNVHEENTRAAIAQKLAALKGYTFAGEYEPGTSYSGRLYFVPNATLSDDETARCLGIGGEDDLFGGFVPHPVMATKVITHPLVEPDATATTGWSHDFARAVKPVTLFGYAAFCRADAFRAGVRVLESGRARVKPACGVGGRGQVVVSTINELEAALADMNDAELSRHGVVIESNLRQPVTFSVGRVRVAALSITYCGTQRQTKDNRGDVTYGGSDLIVVRGDYDDLLNLALTAEAWIAVSQARAYDIAASREFPGFFASRRNYDVAQGLDSTNRRCSGVLEQSWRIGGASPAELVALEAFSADPALHAVRASCVELYGLHETPPNAVLEFRGIDDRVGAITKYTVLDTHADLS